MGQAASVAALAVVLPLVNAAAAVAAVAAVAVVDAWPKRGFGLDTDSWGMRLLSRGRSAFLACSNQYLQH